MADCNQIVDVLQGKEPESRAFVHKLNCCHQTIIHENRLLVEKTQDKTQQLQIKNYLATNAQGKLIKVTEIHLEDRVIQITDLFTPLPGLQFDLNPSAQPLASTPQRDPRPCHSSKERLPSQARQKRPKHSRHVNKTILRLFQKWIAKHSPPELNLSDKMKVLIEEENQRFSTRLLVRMAKEPLLQEAFLMFSESERQILSSSSNTHGKSSYMEALDSYRRVCLDPLSTEVKQSDKQLDDEEVSESKSNDQDQFDQ